MQYRSPTTFLHTALACWDSRDLTATADWCRWVWTAS
jgi:hypothetical protein